MYYSGTTYYSGNHLYYDHLCPCPINKCLLTAGWPWGRVLWFDYVSYWFALVSRVLLIMFVA